ncbi:MAG TPA: triose-phosphate isomerase [Thermoanaerobaculia bacterium]|nr:triose-phosphate isomerase [Thermoanaerobaculia bacterium]
MSRRPLFAANWKMNLLAADVRRFARELDAHLTDLFAGWPFEVVVFPSHPLLPVARDTIGGIEACSLGGQDLHPEASGAHTGDVSGAQLADAGAEWVLCGHSERRADHDEDDATVRAKLDAAVAAGLRPLLCIGESLEQREAGATEATIGAQLEAALPTLAALSEPPVVAYEPVWAIGTGRTATPETAQEAHAFLRGRLGSALGAERAGTCQLLYGGSVKPDNCVDLLAPSDVDGFLIGGASLDPGSFLDIIRRCGPRPRRS